MTFLVFLPINEYNNILHQTIYIKMCNKNIYILKYLFIRKFSLLNSTVLKLNCPLNPISSINEYLLLLPF